MFAKPESVSAAGCTFGFLAACTVLLALFCVFLTCSLSIDILTPNHILKSMKVFSLEEARNLLIKIKPIVEDINLKKSELFEIYSRLEEEQDELEKMYYQTKDEETIMFWHELNDGFSGRKPVDYLKGSESFI